MIIIIHTSYIHHSNVILMKFSLQPILCSLLHVFPGLFWTRKPWRWVKQISPVSWITWLIDNEDFGDLDENFFYTLIMIMSQMSPVSLLISLMMMRLLMLMPDVYQEKGNSPFEKPWSSSRVSKEEEGIHKVPWEQVLILFIKFLMMMMMMVRIT